MSKYAEPIIRLNGDFILSVNARPENLGRGMHNYILYKDFDYEMKLMDPELQKERELPQAPTEEPQESEE